jgi:hypothetical protein
MSILSAIDEVLRKLSGVMFKRPDGELVTRIHPYRKMLSYMMPTRNEAVCYYEDLINAEALQDYLVRASTAWGFEVDIVHCLVAAAVGALHENPKMNQFVVGKRLYARNHVAITFSMKRKKLNKEAKLSAIKMHFDDPAESFPSICRRINEKISHERTTKKTSSDKELEILTHLPRPLLSGVLSVVDWLDYHNLLPLSFIRHDAFYTSMVIANLGSLGMRAAYHHLYEYGTCPLFMMVGQVEERAMVVEGKVVVQKILPIRWSYDERIDDGLTSKYGMQSVRLRLENPAFYFGEIKTEKKVAGLTAI